MKMNQIQCDKCGNMLRNGGGEKEDHNVVSYNHSGHAYVEEVDLCEKCIHKFRKLFIEWLECK